MIKKLLLALVIFIMSPALATNLPATEELRYCGGPLRSESGEIVRRNDVLYAFKKIHPCPVTGLSTGACPGWQMDHIIPLACGGCDSVNNMQWLPVGIKTAAVIGKDRFERKIYCNPMVLVK